MYYEIFILHSKLLKALAHPKRLEIVLLLRKNELNVGDIQNMLDLPQGNISQHLQILRSSKVLKTRKDGKLIYYSIAHKNFIKATDLLREILIERYKDQIPNGIFKKIDALVPLTSDPVCKMRLSPKTAGFAYKNNGYEYYFCGSGCYEKFKENPKKYVEK